MSPPAAPPDPARSGTAAKGAAPRALNYAGTAVIVKPGEPHLGGNIRSGDPYTFCPRVWRYVIERFTINSVLDLGSGTGEAAEFFFRQGLRTIAVEGMAENVRAARYPTICHDLTRGPVVTETDLVHCQEVVEHVDEAHLDNLLRSLACGRVILMTHAPPGQTGHHHVNLQPSEYWVGHISARGYSLLAEDTERVRKLAAEDRAVYMELTGLVFHRT